MNSPVRRPGSVTFLVVMIWISAVVDIAAGALVFVVSFSDAAATEADLSVEGLRVVGVVMMLVGVITGLIASRLGAGSNGARLLITLLELVGVVAAVVTIAGGTADAVAHGVGPLVITGVVLALLWNSRASAFFHSR